MKVFQGECEYQSLMYVGSPSSSLPLQPPSAFKNLGETTKRLQPSYRLEMNLFYSNAYPPSVTTIPSAKTARASYSSISLNSKQHSLKSLTIFFLHFFCRLQSCALWKPTFPATLPTPEVYQTAVMTKMITPSPTHYTARFQPRPTTCPHQRPIINLTS